MAGSIDNLNFEIILKDDEFGKRVQENMKLAKELNVSLTALLDLQSKIKATGVKTPNATQQIVNQEKVAAAQKKTAAAEEALAAAKKRTQAAEEALAAATARRVAAEQRAIAATARSVNAQTSLQRSMNRTTSAAKMQAGLLGDLKGLALQYLSIRGVASFISSLVRVTGEFELQKTTLAAMLGDLSQAQAIMSDIKGLAVQSPFQFKELSTYAKQLTAFAVPAEQLFETTKMLADVSAGLGVGMDRIVLAYGQVKSAAFLRGQEVRQFTEAGIPILNMLAKQFEQLEGDAVSVGEVFDRISSRMVSFEMVNQVFKDLTSEGGKFYKMQETQADTLRGKISNLTDAYEIMLNEMGSKKSGFLKGSVDSLRNLMTHWEAVGKAITAVVVALGVYKGTLAAIAVAEKIAATKALVHKWQLLNSVLKGMGKNVSKMKTAWMVFGNSAKTAMGLAGAAAGALLTIIISNISKIGELKRELNDIVASEAFKSDKSIRNLDLLVANLEKATQGSQEYRDIIAQLNRQYGEYLPKVLSEADAYNDVAIAAQSAAEAIKSKAKASAYDRGMEAIEEKHGKNVEEGISSLISSVTELNPAIAEDSASRFVSIFLAALKKEGGRDNVVKTFTDTFNEYFGKESFDTFGKAYLKANDQKALLDLVEKIKKGARSLSDASKKLEKEKEQLNNTLNARFADAAYDSYTEEQRATEIEAEYQKALSSANDALKKKVITQKAYNKQVKDLDIKKLEQYRDLYKELDIQDKVDFYQLKLDALKVPEGWRGLVQGIIEGKDLDKYSSFGLWAEETTNSVDYVEDMVKRYKELKEQIDLVQPFDEKQANRLKQNKELIEEIAKALDLDIKKLAASKKGESEEEKRLKRLISALRDLQTQYEKLKALGASDESIKKLFEGLYPELIAENGKDFVTDLKYLERGIKLAKDLKKIDANAGKKALVDLGGDEFSIFLKNLQAQNKAYKEASKAAEDYFKTLREWQAEDFNIQGKGIIFDVNKITSDLQGAINKIELKATKLKETFTQIIPEDFKSTIEVYAVARIKNKELAKQFRDSLKEIDSDDIASIYKLLTEQLGEQSAESIIKTAFPALKTIQESFTKEFGADAWTAFWESFLKEGAHAIEALADKQTEYEKKKAQEKLNDLAQKYVKENTAGLNMSDWGDKSIQQIKMIQQKLESLLNNVQLPKETVKVIDALGLSTEDLINKIKDLLGGHIENASIEKFKALSKVIKTVTEQTDKLGGALEELGDTMNSTFLKGFGSAIKYLGDFTDMMLESSLLTPSFSKKLEDASNTTGELAESAADAAENTAKSADLITMAIKIGLSLITSFVEGINESEKAFQDARIRAIEYANAINSVNLDNLLKGSETIFGTDSYQQARDAMDEAKKYLATINDLQKNIQVTQEDLQDTFSASAWSTFNSSFQDKMKEMANLGLGDILIDERSGWDKFWGTAGSDLIKSFNIADFFDENGILKGEELRNFYNQYAEYMSDANREAILQMLGQWDNYVKAMETTTAYLSDMMGQVADNMADSFVDSFKESGEAALDYAQIMDDVATNIAKSVVKSMIIEQVADPELIKEIGNLLLSGDEAGALSLIDKAMQSAEALTPKIQAFLETMEPYFQMGGEESQNLAEGIKGMTEDTANLLASYLNAIRADVSYAKSIWERMDKNTQAIASAIASFPIPSLMEYQAQIAANTYNTAIHTQDILFELRSVMASDGGPTAIRVLM